MPTLTHLHVHSHFTLLGATPPIEKLVAAAAADQMSHLALTDRNVLYGAVAFQQACQTAAIEPIVGMTLTVQLPPGVQPSSKAQQPVKATLSEEISQQPESQQLLPTEEIVLLATNRNGYRSLCRLSSLIQSSPNREALAVQGLHWEQLKDNTQGLIAIAGGRKSWLQRAVAEADNRFITGYIGRFAGLFDDHGYLALELHHESDESIAREISRLGRRFGLPCVAVQPIYTLAAEERSRLRLLAAIDRNCALNKVPASVLPDGDDATVDLHWLHPKEMERRFANFPAALAESQSLVARCEPALPDGKPIFPVLSLPDALSAEHALAAMANEGMEKFFSNEYQTGIGAAVGSSSIRQRLQQELDLIARTGYAPLFLVVADIVRFARSQSIPVSTRGSVANSLVAYCTGITTVDPIANDLLFERFLNPERANPPDIDLDFCSVRRDEVLHYVRQTYGKDRVALVATISTMRPRSAVGETAKALGMDESESAQLVKLLPDEWHPDPRRRVHSSLEAMLALLKTAEQRQVVSAAYDLIGTPHHLSIHPGGLVITPGPTTDFAPVQWTPKGFLIIQFNHEDAEAIGLAKLDLLGIRALTVLADAAALVKQTIDPDFTLESIPTNDELTAEVLATGDTIGVFQCESSGARRTLRQLKAKSIADLAVANAFFKPGPATGGMAASFVRRYRGDEPTNYLHPSLEPILGTTKGVLIFQEQVLRVARQIAGMSWAEADYLRKGMSKFQADSMAQIRLRFIDGCMKISDFSQEQAVKLWEQVEAFAGYGFNQGHATAYADVSYRSAWLKAHYPAAFLAARLANYGGFHHPAIYIAEAKRLGIDVRPPHINHSNHDFTLGAGAPYAIKQAGRNAILWMGLGQVRNLRNGIVEQLIQERRQRIFTDITDLLRRVQLQPREIVNLIRCGALDGLAESRAELLEMHGERGTGKQQLAFDFAAPAIEPESLLQRYRWEREILGQPITVDPLEITTFPAKQFLLLQTTHTTNHRSLSVSGYRLPGWTGGKGFYLSDGKNFTIAIPNQNVGTPRSWIPLTIIGHWQTDEWGGNWFQIERWDEAVVQTD